MNKSPSIQTAQSQFIIYFSINPREKKVPKHPSSKKIKKMNTSWRQFQYGKQKLIIMTATKSEQPQNCSATATNV